MRVLGVPPEPETLERLHHEHNIGSHQYRCGCELRATTCGAYRWHLCPYHDGYDDGVTAMKEAT